MDFPKIDFSIITKELGIENKLREIYPDLRLDRLLEEKTYDLAWVSRHVKGMKAEYIHSFGYYHKAIYDEVLGKRVYHPDTVVLTIQEIIDLLNGTTK
jgi:hypothetical protein